MTPINHNSPLRASSPRLNALIAAMAAAPHRAEQLMTAFLDGADDPAMPLVEPDPLGRTASGTTMLATFIHRSSAPYQYLVANKLTAGYSPRDTQAQPLPHVPAAAITVRVPDRWMSSYQFLEAQHPLTVLPKPFEVVADGVIRTRNGGAREQLWNAPDLSVAALPGAPPMPPSAPFTQWTSYTAQLTWPVSGSTAPVIIRSHPLAGADSLAVVCTDGAMWHNDPALLGALEHAIACGDVPPVHVVFVFHAAVSAADKRAREADYTCDGRSQQQVLHDVQALLRTQQPRWDSGQVLVGQSLGGLFALFGAQRQPSTVVAAVAQSPSLWWPHHHSGTGQWVHDQHARDVQSAARPAPCVIQAGTLETILHPHLQTARGLLAAHDALISTDCDEVVGGHDRAWWRRTVVAGIRAALHACPMPASS